MSQRLASILGLFLAGVIFAAAHRVAALPASTLTGTWASDHGSVLVIQSIGPDGTLTGTYTNNAPGYRCGGTAFPIIGLVDGPRVSYTVRWKKAAIDCTSITSWTGYVRDGRLGVEWVVTYEEDGASRVRIGSDSYRRQ